MTTTPSFMYSPITQSTASLANTSFLPTNTSLDNVLLMTKHCKEALYIDRYITPIWYVIGTLGNLLSLVVWTSRGMRRNNTSAIYLTSLSISDLLFLWLHVIQELKYAWFINVLDAPVLCQLYYVSSMVTQYLSPALVFCFTIERYIAICHPFFKERYCTLRRARQAVAVVVTTCTFLSCTQAFLWRYDDVSGSCEMSEGVWWPAWLWASELSIFLLLPLTNLFFNVLVIAEVRKKENSRPDVYVKKISVPRDRKIAAAEKKKTSASGSGSATTVMLLSVSFYVIATTLPATICYLLYDQFPQGDVSLAEDEVAADPKWQRHFRYLLWRKVVEECCLSHYACNFVLYVITGRMFRKTLKSLFSSRGALQKARCPQRSPLKKQATMLSEAAAKTQEL